MTRKKQQDVPDYEVEFIPVERRLSDRRANDRNRPFPGDRRNRERRAENEGKESKDDATGGAGAEDPRKPGGK